MKKPDSRMQQMAARSPQPTPGSNRQSPIANRKSSPPVWLMAMLLVLGTIALYWPATRCGFVNLDDNVNVTDNVHILKGLTWENIKWAFLNPMATLWQPLTMLSHMAICQACGLNPWGHHLANVLLHALNAGLVFAWLQRMTGATWRSLLVAALFAVHPLRVEAVAWVTERRDVLSAFFGLLALMAYARYAQGARRKSEDRSPKTEGNPKTEVRRPKEDPTRNVEGMGRAFVPGSAFEGGCSTFNVQPSAALSHLPSSIFYLLSLFFLALGLMSKPMLVTWPLVMLLLDYWPLGRMQNAECRMQDSDAGDTQHATRNTPYASRFTFHASRLTSQSPIANRQSPILFPLLLEKIPFFVLVALTSLVTFAVQKREGILAVGEGLPLSARLGNALISYCRYLGKMFWPVNLAVYYPHPGHWPLGKVLAAGGLLLGITVLVWLLRRRHPYLLMGWLWYCGTLVPVSQVIQTGAHAMADRWTYLPCLGVLVLAVWGAGELVRGKAEGRRQKEEKKAEGTMVKEQRGARLHPSSFILHPSPHILLWVPVGMAVVLGLAMTRQQIGYWQESETLLRHTLEVSDNNGMIQRNLACALLDKGQIDEAISHFREFVRLRPEVSNSHYNLGIALYKKGQMDEAIRQLQEATRLDPDDAAAHFNLGTAFYQQGRTGEAIRQFQETIRLKPDGAEAHNNLGTALGMQGQTDEAIRQFQEALRLKPDYAEARRNLDTVLGSKAGSSPAPGAPTNSRN